MPGSPQRRRGAPGLPGAPLTFPDMTALLLLNATLGDGRVADVLLRDGLVASVGTFDSGGLEQTLDLAGYLLLPALVEPHAHLDKSLIADSFPNPTGDLLGAIGAIEAGWDGISVADIADRATRTAMRLVASGVGTIRSHADMRPPDVMKSVNGLLEARRRLSDLVDLQVVVLSRPLTGPGSAACRDGVQQALELGVDALGGVPDLEADPHGCIRYVLDLAAANDRMVDFHLDEDLDVAADHYEFLARETSERGLEGRVTASHCVSHGMLPADRQLRTAEAMAAAGISVVTNPRTNLYLQARGVTSAPPRGMAGMDALLAAGVNVAGGADNVQDPFYPIGRCDPLETASLLVAAGHRDVATAARMIGPAGRRALGLEELEVVSGAPADLVAIKSGSVREAIADQPADRIVFRRGREVVRTSTTTSWSRKFDAT